MNKKFSDYLLQYSIAIVVSISFIFFLVNILAVHGLQDWWPSLLMHWSNDKILYKDVHYFTGPLLSLIHI
jgi:ABC-type phosphate transport system auxiliary subunit